MRNKLDTCMSVSKVRCWRAKIDIAFKTMYILHASNYLVGFQGDVHQAESGTLFLYIIKTIHY